MDTIQLATGKGDETKSYPVSIFRKPTADEAIHVINALSLNMDEGPYTERELPHLNKFAGYMFTFSHITIGDCIPCSKSGSRSIIEFWECFRSFCRDNKRLHPYIGVPMNLPDNDPLIEFMNEDYDKPEETTKESVGGTSSSQVA